MAGIQVFLMPAEDIRVGGRRATATSPFSLPAADLDLLPVWEPKVDPALRALPPLTGIASDSPTGRPAPQLPPASPPCARACLLTP